MKNSVKYLIILLFASSCTKTGAGYRPVVDTNNPRFEQDLQECQLIARQYVDLGYDTAVKVGGATAIGAGVGQLLGGNTGSTVVGAGIGLGVSGVKKVLSHNDERKDIVKNCLSGRGYRILK